MIRRSLMAAGLALGALVPASVAWAQFPTFHATLTSPDSYARPGVTWTVGFSANIKNNGPTPVYINGATITLHYDPALATIDDSKFYVNMPTVMAGNTSQNNVAIFDVIVDGSVPFGTEMFGSIEYLGGLTSTSMGSLDINHFKITVVPEGGSLGLMAAGVLALFAGTRKRRNRLEKDGEGA